MRPAPLILAVALSLLASAVRTRGWFETLRAAYPDAKDLRHRDVLLAYFTGAGLNGLLPGRVGDAVKLAALRRRRLPEAPYPTLAATLVPPGAVDGALGAGLVLWLLATGIVQFGELQRASALLQARLPLVLVCLGAVGVLAWLLRRRLPQVVAQARAGVAILARPRRLVGGILVWGVLARLIRLAAVAAFIASFSLPLSFATVALVAAVQGMTPALGPAMTPVRALVLAYGFPRAAGEHISLGRLAELLVGSHLALTIATTTIMLAIVAVQLHSLSPRRVLGHLQQAAMAGRVALRGAVTQR
jgi:hypothetical protein